MRFYEFNPVAAWTFARIRRENFNDVAGVEHGVERHDFPLTFAPIHLFPTALWIA